MAQAVISTIKETGARGGQVTQHSWVCLDSNNLITVSIIMPYLNSFLIFLKSQDTSHVTQSCSLESFLVTNISEKANAKTYI